MLVTIGGRKVEVLDKGCRKRECFSLGFDKGSFAAGRGYTSYHRDKRGRVVEKPVCGTRHYRGCPTNSVCPVCRGSSVEPTGTACDRSGCEGVTVAREDLPPVPPNDQNV